ncbi:ABC-F family ATP-binding cassette domain-containing protein [Pelagibacteraceae bacterium]|nr:ABC-F family ATP-binding cassette domain-containing protein [Pelagibacteraceae bacterium]
MVSDLLFSLRDVEIKFGKKIIFQDLNLNLHKGDMIALVGKNGVGKTTLMKTINGDQDLDSGELWSYPNLKVGYFNQKFEKLNNKTIQENFSDLLNEQNKHFVDIFCNKLNLDKLANLEDLSGGQKRKVYLIRSLLKDSDVLLLDEPTNHLDLQCIEWLESYLRNLNKTIICVSHDRTFLSNFTNKVFWIDRGKLRVSPRGFKNFDKWSEELLDQEYRELRNRKQFVNIELEWANKGIKARVKRNEKRLKRAKELKAQLEKDEASYRSAIKSLRPQVSKKSTDQSKFIAELQEVFVKYPNQSEFVFKNLSIKISKNDRIGLLGNNGSGKSTFLRTILNEIKITKGKIKLKKNLEFSYFDQMRNDLNGRKSIKDILVPSGGDYLKVQGRDRHVCSYVKDFQFDPKNVNHTIQTLSGGEQNRLLLAKVLANPKTGLILDEPTNDLDLETLDLLTEMLSNYNGTLLIVSHDRDFLDQTVNKILHFKEDGHVSLFFGGYSDFLKSENQQVVKNKETKKSNLENNKAKNSKPKLSYKFQYELEQLPNQIKNIQQELKDIKNELKDTNLYLENYERYEEITSKMEVLNSDLNTKENRWYELIKMEEDLVSN